MPSTGLIVITDSVEPVPIFTVFTAIVRKTMRGKI